MLSKVSHLNAEAVTFLADIFFKIGTIFKVELRLY